MAKRALLLFAVSGCVGMGITSGPVAAPIDHSPVGVEVRGFGGYHSSDYALPNTFGFAVRQIGDAHTESALQVGWMAATHAGQALLFGRLMFDTIAWQKQMDGSTKLSALSPTLDLGVAPWRHGICFTAGATWDIHYDAPDQLIVGGFVGLCGDTDKLH